MGLPSGTPLEAVRRRLEWGWRDLEDEDDEAVRPLDPDLAARRHRLRLLREVLMTFETGDRDEQERTTTTPTGPPRGVRAGAPDRLETLDGGGALVDGDTAIERGRQRPWSGYDFCTTLQKELTGDPAARDALVAEAHHRHRDLPRVHVLETT